jgi:hypothetical protein
MRGRGGEGERLFEKGEFEGVAPQALFSPQIMGSQQPFQTVSEDRG